MTLIIYQHRLIRIGYTLGIALVIAAIIYFFGASWSGLGRLSKIALSAGLVALFYGAAFIPARLRFLARHSDFLARLLLVGGTVAFGVAVALIGRTYHTYADEFTLFAIWSIAALLMAAITRHGWFYLLAYALVHIAIWSFFFPTSAESSDLTHAAVYGFFAVANLVLYGLVESGRFQAPILRYASYIVFHIALLWLSNSFVAGSLGYALNIVTVAGIAGSFWYFGKFRVNRWALSMTALAASAFAVLKFIELAEHYHSMLFFFFGLLFVAALLFANVLFFRYVGRLGATSVSMIPEDRSTDGEAVPSARHEGSMATRIVPLVVTIVGVTIGTISLIGLIMLASWNVKSEYVLTAISMVFIIAMIAIPRLNDAVRYTIMTIGYLVGVIANIGVDHPLVMVLYVVAAIVGWVRFASRMNRWFMYGLFNVFLIILLMNVFDYRLFSGDREESWTYILIVVAAINGVVYWLRDIVSVDGADRPLREDSLTFGMLLLYWLTFMDPIFAGSYVVFNILFFAVTTWLVLRLARSDRRTEFIVVLALWFAYLVYKYYDQVWPLLHKSFTLLIGGAVILLATAWIERRMAGQTEGEVAMTSPGLPYSRWLPIILVILIQLAILAFQTVLNERDLVGGEPVSNFQQSGIYAQERLGDSGQHLHDAI